MGVALTVCPTGLLNQGLNVGLQYIRLRFQDIQCILKGIDWRFMVMGMIGWMYCLCCPALLNQSPRGLENTPLINMKCTEEGDTWNSEQLYDDHIFRLKMMATKASIEIGPWISLGIELIGEVESWWQHLTLSGKMSAVNTIVSRDSVHKWCEVEQWFSNGLYISVP